MGKAIETFIRVVGVLVVIALPALFAHYVLGLDWHNAIAGAVVLEICLFAILVSRKR